MLRQNMRFVIDRRCKIYEKQISEDVTKDTSFPLITYDITRVDSVLYDYQGSGLFEFMVTQDEQHETDGYYVIDGKGYWLCYEPAEKEEEHKLTCKIIYDDDVVYYDLEPAVFIAKFYNESGEEVSGVTSEWLITGEQNELLDVTNIGNDIEIEANNKKLLNKSFTLSLSADGYEPDTVIFTVRAFL